MSLINVQLDTTEKGKMKVSQYKPTDDEKGMIAQIVRHFTDGWTTMYKPRREWNDLSTIDRLTYDRMMFNTYQPNNGDPLPGDQINGWRSRAIRPVVRNKVISIAAHATARLIFPKIFAQNANDEEDRDAAQVMEDLMEWVGDQMSYPMLSMYATITALVDPAAIVYTEYTDVKREVRRIGEDGKYKKEMMVDEDLSGFNGAVVPVDEMFIENFYEPDIQKQGWLIWRRVISYSLAEAKYKNKYDNFKYVKPGVMTIFNDANATFYEVYDSTMRQNEVEEVLYWNKSSDTFVIVVNGILMTPFDNPNPRLDKRYPFAKFGYEIMNEGKCFYFKSLANKISQDAKIVNTLYPMIIDGTYLNLFPPMVATGGEDIGADVIIPGAITTLSSPDASMREIKAQSNITQGMNTLFKVEESLSQSSQEPLLQGASQGGSQTAYEISRIENNAATVLGLFIRMIGSFVKDYGNLMVSDIIQYLTIAEVTDIAGKELAYKTFVFPDKQTPSGTKNRRIQFNINMPDEEISAKKMEDMSFDILEKEGGENGDTELYEVNPTLFRKLKYKVRISPDVLNPMSEDLERAFMLEEYDRAIANPLLDQEQVTRDFLLMAYPKSRKNPDKYFSEQQAVPSPFAEVPGQESSPLSAMKEGGIMNKLPQVPSTGPLSS